MNWLTIALHSDQLMKFNDRLKSEGFPGIECVPIIMKHQSFQWRRMKHDERVQWAKSVLAHCDEWEFPLKRRARKFLVAVINSEF